MEGEVTEQQWRTINDPATMLRWLRCSEGQGKASPRKLRLFACACVRLVWSVLSDEKSRQAVVTAERFADGEVTRKELAGDDVREQATRVIHGSTAARAARKTLLKSAARAAEEARFMVNQALIEQFTGRITQDWMYRRDAINRQMSHLLRDIVGNPFAPPPGRPACLAAEDGTVARLARAIYDERAFDGLPVLADALEEAGCTDRALLDHFRQGGEHARGCWALDCICGLE
jgi:hypothetical protein